jgi:transposase
MSQLTLTAWQRRRLRRQLEDATDVSVYRRTLAVLEFDRGRSVAAIAGMLGVTRQSVYNWLRSYRWAGDPSALEDRPGRGRRPLLDEEDDHFLGALLARSPQELGYPHANWTVPLLQQAMQLGTGLLPSDDTIRRALRRLHYVWKRPRYALDPDPDLAPKRRRIRRRVRQLRPRSVLLAEDETDLLLFPPLRAAWSLRGQPQEVGLSGRNARRVVFGAMNLHSGTRLLLAREHQRAGDFQAFLRVVHHHYRGWHVALLLDEDPSHTAKGSVELAGWFEIELISLPKRAPQLNPMDTLWGQGKDVVSANKQYASIDVQVGRFLRHLEGLSGEEALRTSGVLSEDFWLKGAVADLAARSRAL